MTAMGGLFTLRALVLLAIRLDISILAPIRKTSHGENMEKDILFLLDGNFMRGLEGPFY